MTRAQRAPEITADRSPLLEGRGLHKSYGGLSALKQVDIEIHSGEMVGVVGPNGSGKTTLFDCLTGMEPLSAGRVSFKGRDITGTKPFRVARMGLSRTFQGIRLYRQLTVLENLLLSRNWAGERFHHLLRPSGVETGRRAEDLIEFLTLAEHRTEPAGSLSWGQQRLLEIGMVLMPDPDLILLDEATSGVNPALVEVIKDRIRALNRTEGKTIVMIEHNIDVIAELCDRVVVLDHGEQLAEGTVDDVFSNPDVIEAYLGKHDAGA